METDTCRHHLATYCVGNGLDVGFGGSPIRPEAICLDRAPDHGSRAHCDTPAPTQLVGDAASLFWFKDGVLDYVYSSHTLEDFEDTEAVLAEWTRVLRPGGRLVLFLPDQPTYARYCAERDELPNQAHKHADFGPEFIRHIARRLPLREVLMEFPVPYNPYSFAAVFEKV